MKPLVFICLILFIYIKQIKSFTGTVTLVEDNYSHTGYCRPTHFVNVTSSVSLSTLYFRDANGATQNPKFTITYSEYISPNYYLSGYLTNGFYQLNPTSTLHAKDATYGNEQSINAVIDYVCQLPPIINITEPVNFNVKPIHIETIFSVYVDNLEKRIQKMEITSKTVYPFSISYVNCEPFFINFKLVYEYSNLSAIINSEFLYYEIDYGVLTNFTLKIIPPINYYTNTSIVNISKYPNSPYITSNNWDINNMVFIDGFSIDPKLYFYAVYNTGILDKNQFFSLISGNLTNGQFLFLSSSFPPSRISLQYSFTFGLYAYGIQNNFSDSIITNNIIKPNFNNYGIFTHNEPFKWNELYIRCLYPDDYKISFKFGNNNYFTPTYPYGIALLSSDGNCIYDISYANGYDQIEIATDIGFSYNNPASISNDTTPPKLVDFQLFYPRGGDGNYAILKVHIIDTGSGFSFMYYGGNYITVSDLINGTIKDGYYEKLIYVTFDTTCKMGDIDSNIVICNTLISDVPSNQNIKYYYGVNPSDSIPYLVDTDFEITRFDFESSVYDISETGRLVSFYLNYSKSQPDIPISFFLTDRNYGDKYIDINSKSNRYLMDKDLNLFKITFYIPPKLCTGTLPFLIIIHGKQFRNHYFYSKFGDQANLNVFSNDCYELPPRVTSLSYLENSPITLDSNQTIGWSFEVHSGSDIKISYAFFHVTSNLDKKGYTFEFYPNSTSFSASITMDLSPSNTPSQIFKIYNATLIDERGIRSDHIDNYRVEEIISNQSPTFPLSISPFYLIDKGLFTINVSSTFIRESMKPIISLSTLQGYHINSFLESSLYFSLATSDNVGISINHLPQVYLEQSSNYGDFKIIQCITKINETSVTLCKYDIICNVGYGYGIQNSVSVSVYGVVDTSLNIASYSSLELNQTYDLNDLTNSKKPSISGWAPLTPNNDKLTIFGRNLPTSGGNAYLYYTDSDIDNLVVLVFSFSSSVMAVLEIGPSTKPFIIYTQDSNNQTSNKVEIHYLGGDPSSSSSSTSSSSSSSASSSDDLTLPPTSCLDNCGGSSRGTCIPNIGCHCKSPYSGINCLSETIKVPKPYINSTSPDSRNEFPVSGADIKLNTIISILALRELNFEGKQVNIHYFDSWNFTTVSSTNFTYDSTILKNNQHVSNISVVMEWYEQSSIITFAKQNLTINPSTLKYYISIDKYPFASSLNTLDLIIKSTFKSSQNDDICGSKEFSLNDGNNYMTLQIGKYSFEGKFIKKAIINGNRIVSINNKLLDDNETNSDTTTKEKDMSNQQSSFISIQIPHYDSNILLDPSFSVLLDTNESSKNSGNSICTSNKSSKLSAAQVTGIVIGSFIIVVIVFLFIFVKFSKTDKSLSVKIFFYKSCKRFKRKY
ncbi:hypothetical protein ACTA71_006358 [Dictyostelium dimigraforme]